MQSDYIMKMIEQFARAIASIISSRKANNHEEATKQICNASLRYLETDIAKLMKLDVDQLQKQFTSNGGFDNERGILCADLLFEMALISEAKGFPEAVSRLKTSCLNLYLVAIPADTYFQTSNYFNRVSSLIEDLSTIQFSDAMQNNLETYQNFLKQRK